MAFIIRTLVLEALLVATCATVGIAQDRSASVDQLFTKWDSPVSPGAAVLVTHRGAIVHAKGYGMANLEHAIPNTTKTVFEIGSVSKQFTGMAIALLVSDGRLSLGDDVRKYIPELHNFGHTIHSKRAKPTADSLPIVNAVGFTASTTLASSAPR